ncbi:MAG TPA: acetylornithine deacetylase [Steroidobacteraceae bacterium]|jgi:acetylornithine deacetylase|nr:acetylornithine deacetylase [Steroidobacteraceae bacterium]
MNAVLEPKSDSGRPSAESRAMIERLIGFNTVSHDSNLGLIEWVRDYLHGVGAVTRLTHDPTGKKANLFATLGDSPKPGLILSGHTDVVPVDGQSWDTDPFLAVERDGKLFARGSADMKGFIGIALAQAPRFVAALNDNRLDAPLHYSLSYDEEVGCIGVRGLIRDLEENNIRPAGCVVGEPTSMQPIIAHKGTHRFRCRVLGREAHSSYVTYGVNAIEYAARLVVFIRHIAERLAQVETRDYGFTVPYSTLSTGLIQGGIAANVVPKDCVFQFDMRTLPNTSPESLYQEIRAYAQELTREMHAVDEKSGIDLEWLSQTAGLAAAETDAIVQWAMQLSRNCQVGKVSYGTEAGLFQKMGVPSVICGPGDIAQAHRPNEFVTLEQLAQCERFMDRILETGYAS